MNLGIDTDSPRPYVIDALTAVCGEEYRPVISKRTNDAIIMDYQDIEGLSYYLSYIKRCKARSYVVDLLDKIGIDTAKLKKSNYTEPLDKNMEEIVECFMKPSSKNKMKILLTSLIRKTSEESSKQKHLKVFKMIYKYNLSYEDILFKYNEWKNQLLPYEEYIKFENKRKDACLEEKRKEVMQEILPSLPSFVKNMLSNKTIEEKANIILGSMDIASNSSIEFFGEEQMEKLKSNNVRLEDKHIILLEQVKYLKRLGVDVPKKLLWCITKEQVSKYLSFLNDSNISQYLPSIEKINNISSIRKRKYEEALFDYYKSRKDFTDLLMKYFENTTSSIEFLYDHIKNKIICVTGGGYISNKNEFSSVMFYTIRDSGLLDYDFLHEFGHIISQNDKKGIGFEHYNDFIKEGNISRRNPYNKALRKYEKFGEAINDVLITEAYTYLRKKKIYLIDPPQFASCDVSNINTPSIIRNLLNPLFQKFRPQIIKAHINADPDELTKYIGEDNFEKLVDAINKVDHLVKNGLLSELDNSKEDEIVIEYFEQIERVQQIYIDIDEYYNCNLQTSLENTHEFSQRKAS